MHLRAVILAVLVAGCSNFSTLQTARTLPTGTFRVALGGGTFTSNKLSAVVTGDNNNTSATPNLTFPYVELGGRLGVARHFDLGAKYTFPGSMGVDGKFQFVDGSLFAAAIGAYVSYLPIVFNNTTLNLLDLAVPLYLSLDFADWIGVYGAVRFVERFQIGSSSSSGSNSTSTPFYAAGGGLRIGNQVGLLGEVTYIRQAKGTFQGLQVAGAVFIGSAPSAGFELGRDGRWNKWHPRDDELMDHPERRRSSEVTHVSADGQRMRVSFDDLRAWKEGEFVCAVDQKGREVACGNVIRVEPGNAVVRITRSKGQPLPGLEVVVRP